MRIRREVQGVIFDEQDGEKIVLLVKKFDKKARHFRWRLLKGGVEAGETETQALKREIFEELGLRNIQILNKIYSYDFVFGDTLHRVSSFLVKANSKENVKLQHSEIADYMWITKDKAVKMLHWPNEKEATRFLR